MTDGQKREFCHSISRLIDRHDQLVIDVERIERNLSDLKADLEKEKQALESFLNDALKQPGVKNDK